MLTRKILLSIIILLRAGQLSRAQNTDFNGRWRYGTISWTLTSANSEKASVLINVESAWRLSDPSIVVTGTSTPISSAGQIFQAGSSNGQDSLLKFGDGTFTGRFDIQVCRLAPQASRPFDPSTR